MSTLSRANEIESDFYQLKSQEWAMSVVDARRFIEQAITTVLPAMIIARRKGWFELSDGSISNHNSSPGDKSYPNWQKCFEGEGIKVEAAFYIWSNEHHMWWRPFGGGYAPLINQAGEFTHDEAIAICRDACRGWNGNSPLPELPVAKSDVAAFADHWQR